MCLIIQRQPNFEIPYFKFENAVINNPHGYGISYPDENGLQVFRTHEEPDPDKLYRLINEDLIDKDLMIHLRYTTAGETILRNSHPFPVLERKTDGIDLRMAHNGTLSKWKPKAAWESDTRNFVRNYVRPLFKRFSKGMEPEELLNDAFTKQLLEDQLSTASVLTFIDSLGNSLICNAEGNGGKKEEGWYYSNTYSFTEGYREPKSYPRVVYPDPNTAAPTKPSTYASPVLGVDAQTEKFSKRYNINPKEDFFHMSDETIEAISTKPSESSLIIKELIYELQQSHKKTNLCQKQLDKCRKETTQ